MAMLMGEEINMAVCQPASQGEHGSAPGVRMPCQQSTLPEIKGREGLKEKMQMSLYKGHTLVITAYFIRPVLSLVFL